MASLVSRLVACLVAVVAVLQLVHLVLLNQLEERRLEELHHLHTKGSGGVGGAGGGAGADKEPSRRLDSINNGLEAEAESEFQPQALSLPHRPNDASHPHNLQNTGKPKEELRLEDIGGEFRVLFDVASHRGKTEGRRQSDEDKSDFDIDVTLVTASDLGKMKRFLVPLIERWQGPLSVSLWVENGTEVESAIGFVAQARRCHDLTRRFVSFHLVFPLIDDALRNKTIPWFRHLFMLKEKTENLCQTFFQELGRITKSDVNEGVRPYPVNLLRNVGRRKVRTKFSLVSDIDLIPSSGLRIKFQRFAKEKEQGGDERKTVFVLPAFEQRIGGRGSEFGGAGEGMPETKTQLLGLIEKYQARPFYFDLCWKCQVHTDYEAWEREPSREQLSVLFEVLWKDPWEPFFISDNSIPMFDERFRQYGFNRLSQLCELHMGGYKFAVLNDAFLVHKGYESPDAFQAGKSRDLELNRAHFRQFKNEMRTKYPHSTRRCY